MVKIIRTNDGSHSLYNEELKEIYHSFHGALSESQYVFVDQGLIYFYQNSGSDNPIKIFEVGMGTGLNALLVAKWAEAEKISIEYTAVESFPLTKEIVGQLNYTELLPESKDLFQKIHGVEWDSLEMITPYFHIKKLNYPLEEVSLTVMSYDIIFYDAFAPSKQPEIWGFEYVDKVVGALKSPGIFVTYCAKGQLKRDLSSLGCEVHTLPGPPGKKEMVRAINIKG